MLHLRPDSDPHLPDRAWQTAVLLLLGLALVAAVLGVSVAGITHLVHALASHLGPTTGSP